MVVCSSVVVVFISNVHSIRTKFYVSFIVSTPTSRENIPTKYLPSGLPTTPRRKDIAQELGLPFPTFNDWYIEQHANQKQSNVPASKGKCMIESNRFIFADANVSGFTVYISAIHVHVY